MRDSRHRGVRSIGRARSRTSDSWFRRARCSESAATTSGCPIAICRTFKPSDDSSRRLLLTMCSDLQRVASHGNGFGVFKPLFGCFDLRPCQPSQPRGLHKRLHPWLSALATSAGFGRPPIGLQSWRDRSQEPACSRRSSATRAGCSRAAKCPVSRSVIDRAPRSKAKSASRSGTRDQS